MRLLKTFVLLGLVLISQSALADLEKSDEESLKRTQELLRNQLQRDQYLKNTPEARANDTELKKLTGNKEATDAVYSLSAQIFENIVKESNGDPIAMQQKLMEAQRNPEAFLKSLTPEQKKSIESIANKINSGRNPSAKP